MYAFVGRAGNGTGSAVDGTRIGGLSKGNSTGSTQWEVSYTYVLSGRTLAYAGYVKIQNEANAAYTFNRIRTRYSAMPTPTGAAASPVDSSWGWHTSSRPLGPCPQLPADAGC